MQAAAKERAVIRRAALAGLGAAGDDLADAVLLIDRALADQADADEEAVAAAAEKATGIRPACSVGLDVGDGDNALRRIDHHAAFHGNGSTPGRVPAGERHAS
ncbi:hypothetical protein ACWC0C_45585 [Streptomyces sp. NPDC001709]